ncbi:MAG: VOC family protein, partial [Pseudomonadota bacterium]
MYKTALWIGALVLLLSGCAQQAPSPPATKAPAVEPTQPITVPAKPEPQKSLTAPEQFASIRYRVSNPKAAAEFFQHHFDFQSDATRPPLPDVTLLTRTSETAALMLTQLDHPQKPAEPHYGVYWLALGVKNLRTAITRFQQSGGQVKVENFVLPADQAPAALLIGPDNTRLIF